VSETVPVVVPDIGDFDSVDIVEVLVGVGDDVSVDQSLITLESDKASMEVPSPAAGRVVEIAVELGGQVGEGDLILRIEPAGAVAEAAAEEAVPAGGGAAGEAATPDQIASVVLFLVSDMASYVTGEVVVVDGAVSILRG